MLNGVTDDWIVFVLVVRAVERSSRRTLSDGKQQ